MPDDPTAPINEHALRVQQLFVRHQQALLAYVLSIEAATHRLAASQRSQMIC